MIGSFFFAAAAPAVLKDRRFPVSTSNWKIVPSLDTENIVRSSCVNAVAVTASLCPRSNRPPVAERSYSEESGSGGSVTLCAIFLRRWPIASRASCRSLSATASSSSESPSSV